MDYKEKYEQALKVAKETYNTQPMYMEWLERMFPELSEGEDEKVRQKILFLFYAWRNNEQVNIPNKKEVEKTIAWLEKQGEKSVKWNENTDGNKPQKHHSVLMKTTHGIAEGEWQGEKWFQYRWSGRLKDSDVLFWIELSDIEKQVEQKASYTTIAKTGDGGINALVTRDIEIPFGAKDSELQEATYYIPKGYYAKIEGDKVTIKKGEQKSFDYENAYIQQKDFAPKEEIPRYNIGDVLCDKSCTTLNKESQSNFEITDIRNGMYICDKCSFPISQQDEYELVAKRIEQKPTDKVELKFHKGQWITNGDYTWKIVEIKPLDYILQSQDGNIVDNTISHVDEQFHSFTIQDAKEGDVLYINNTLSESIMIYKSFNNGVTNKYASYNKFGFEGENYLTLNDGYIIPATKEQRDLLFQKMNEAGYEWDAENKQLNKIYIVHDTYCQENCKGFQETGKCFTDEECKAKKEAEQKLVESEDEKIRKGLIGMLSKYKYVYHKEIAWLEKQGKPSDEEMKTLLRTEYEKGRADVIAEIQKEWSEEDEKEYKYVLKFVDNILNNCGNKKDYEHCKRCYDWLKSLRPQNNWKPSDEQMVLLSEVQNALLGKDCHNRFTGFMWDLKKLKEG